MANYAGIKATIDANIKQNNNQEITGVILNSVLNSMVNSLGDGYQFKGVATTSTNPGTPDQKVFYLGGKGTYSYFGQPTIQPGNLGVFWYDSSWHSEAIDVAPVIEIVNNLTDGGADKALSAEMGKYLGDILEGIPQAVISTWGSWSLSTASPYRAYAIASERSRLNGIITFKLSSYTTYKIAVTIQDGTGWNSGTISETGWKTEDITKQIASGEEGYSIRVSVGRVDNRSITLSEFLSAIDELQYEYMEGQAGLVERVEDLEEKVYNPISDIIPDYIIEGEEKVDITLLSEVAGTLASDKKWVTDVGKHKAIPVTPGEKYVISGDGNGFWGWLTSAYSPPVTQNAAIPYVTGYENRYLQKGAVAVTAPTGAAYLVFVTINGGGNPSYWQIYKVESYRRRTDYPVKFHYASWNIGLFTYTDWTPGQPTHTIPAADAAEYAQRYKQLINGIDADVLGICEYDSSFSAAGQSTKDVIFPCYRHIYEGTKRGANCNTLMFNDLVEYVGKEEILFTTRQEQRYYTHITARLAGENVHLVQAHLDHTYNDKRVAQIAQLITDMAGYKYVIIAGDFNTGDEETIETELAAFTNAGYAMANDGYIGLVFTSLTQEYVDNICVRGFSMSKIGTSQESGTLSDHLLVECNLAMDFQE